LTHLELHRARCLPAPRPTCRTRTLRIFAAMATTRSSAGPSFSSLPGIFVATAPVTPMAAFTGGLHVQKVNSKETDVWPRPLRTGQGAESVRWRCYFLSVAFFSFNFFSDTPVLTACIPFCPQILPGLDSVGILCVIRRPFFYFSIEACVPPSVFFFSLINLIKFISI